jgi:hypothetical protein
MRKLACVLTVCAIACGLLLPAAVQSRELRSHVKFLATGPHGLDIVGESDQIEIASDAQELRVRVPLAPIHTGIDLRDRQLREHYLEVTKHPDAELRVARKALHFPELGARVESQAIGTLTLHGKSKSVRFHYTAQADTTGFAVTGTLRVNLHDHAVESPEYLGATVRPNVDVTVECHVPNTVELALSR